MAATRSSPTNERAGSCCVDWIRLQIPQYGNIATGNCLVPRVRRSKTII